MRNKGKLIRYFIFSISGITALLVLSSFNPWGFWAHKKVNEMAVFILPSELMGFYKSNINYVKEHAVDPDKRRHAVKGEAPKHYIDLDHFGLNPFDSIPISWKKAVEKYSEDTLLEYGILPWAIQRKMFQLTEAFRSKEHHAILKHSADLGHYIADAHVPLHCTENYNGQLTGQKGIHAFWESRLPELFGDRYDFIVGRAKYIDNPLIETWNIIEQSFLAKDSVLEIEKRLDESYTKDKKYGYETRGAKSVKAYSVEYSREYHRQLNGMVERRLRSSILKVGSFWYTAWVDAGQPDLGLEKISSDTIQMKTNRTFDSGRGHTDD